MNNQKKYYEHEINTKDFIYICDKHSAPFANNYYENLVYSHVSYGFNEVMLIRYFPDIFYYDDYMNNPNKVTSFCLEQSECAGTDLHYIFAIPHPSGKFIAVLEEERAIDLLNPYINEYETTFFYTPGIMIDNCTFSFEKISNNTSEMLSSYKLHYI